MPSDCSPLCLARNKLFWLLSSLTKQCLWQCQDDLLFKDTIITRKFPKILRFFLPPSKINLSCSSIQPCLKRLCNNQSHDSPHNQQHRLHIHIRFYGKRNQQSFPSNALSSFNIKTPLKISSFKIFPGEIMVSPDEKNR